jgi:hypothetical protein
MIGRISPFPVIRTNPVIQEDLMRNLRANESTVIGILCLIGVIVVTSAMILMFSTQPWPMQILVCGSLVPLSVIAWFGLRSKPIYIDGDDLLTRVGADDYSRIPISAVISVRTFPLPNRLGIVIFKDNSGNSIMTITREQNLSWIMSKMPDSSITPYWKNQRG